MDRASGIGKFNGFSLVKRENQAGINVGTLHNRLQRADFSRPGFLISHIGTHLNKPIRFRSKSIADKKVNFLLFGRRHSVRSDCFRTPTGSSSLQFAENRSFQSFSNILLVGA